MVGRGAKLGVALKVGVGVISTTNGTTTSGFNIILRVGHRGQFTILQVAPITSYTMGVLSLLKDRRRKDINVYTGKRVIGVPRVFYTHFGRFVVRFVTYCNFVIYENVTGEYTRGTTILFGRFRNIRHYLMDTITTSTIIHFLYTFGQGHGTRITTFCGLFTGFVIGRHYIDRHRGRAIKVFLYGQGCVFFSSRQLATNGRRGIDTRHFTFTRCFTRFVRNRT